MISLNRQVKTILIYELAFTAVGGLLVMALFQTGLIHSTDTISSFTTETSSTTATFT
jgi:hypothetical protein